MAKQKTLTLDVALGIEMPRLALTIPAEVRAQYPDAGEHLTLQLREPKITEQRTMMTPIENASTNDELFDALADLLMRFVQGSVSRDVVRAVVGECTASAVSQILVAVQTGELPDPKQHQQLLLRTMRRTQEQLLNSM